MKNLFLAVLISLVGLVITKGQTIQYSDNFENGTANWVVESETDSTVFTVENNVLDILATKGLTLWYNKPLWGNLKITFDALVVKKGGKYDRASDLNCFWMANDPKNPENMFARSTWRNGVFGKYYSLTTYYVGYGGNNNTTTRFRKYDGDYESFRNKTQRPDILKEYTDTTHLIKSNCWNHIEITMDGGTSKYIVNKEILFEYTDPEPYLKGYFGLRTVTNHMKIKDFRVYQLP